jgi:hypothetical protein
MPAMNFIEAAKSNFSSLDKAVSALPAVGTGLFAAYVGWKEHEKRKKKGFTGGTFGVANTLLPAWALAGGVTSAYSAYLSKQGIPKAMLAGFGKGALKGLISAPFLALPFYLGGRLAGALKANVSKEK